MLVGVPGHLGGMRHGGVRVLVRGVRGVCGGYLECVWGERGVWRL